MVLRLAAVDAERIVDVSVNVHVAIHTVSDPPTSGDFTLIGRRDSVKISIVS
jgi:hypothetical protein